MSSTSKKITIRELCFIAIFVAIIAICAQIIVPAGPVPFTLQAWAVSLAGLILGPKNGMLAALAYVFLGAFGAPVFAGFAGGLGTIMRPTGGFILSFPVVALLAGLGERKGGIFWTILGLAAGSIVNWVVGLLWFNWITEFGLIISFGYAVAPFIIIGIVRTAVLPFVSKSIKAAMKKAGVKL
jgi:biotin transport system substrate-specific component